MADAWLFINNVYISICIVIDLPHLQSDESYCAVTSDRSTIHIFPLSNPSDAIQPTSYVTALSPYVPLLVFDYFASIRSATWRCYAGSLI